MMTMQLLSCGLVDYNHFDSGRQREIKEDYGPPGRRRQRYNRSSIFENAKKFREDQNRKEAYVQEKEVVVKRGKNKKKNGKIAAVKEEECCVCMNEDATVLLLPCRHQCVCVNCRAMLETCPICRGAVNDN